MTTEQILILNLGGQVNQLLARRVRDLGVYCQVKPYTISMEEIENISPIGIIFTGGPNSLQGASPTVDSAIFTLGIPILGVGYAHFMIVKQLGGAILPAVDKLISMTETHLEASTLLASAEKTDSCYLHQYGKIESLPIGFTATASTPEFPAVVMENAEKQIYGLQFQPEIKETKNGMIFLKSFLFDICKASGDWSMKDYAASVIPAIREQVGNGKVLLALSGGVDSSVVASLLSKAIGSQLYCIFVDHGLMRKNEGTEIEAVFGNSDMNFIRIDGENRFLGKLKGITDPEQKRKIIGEEFIRVFEEEAKKLEPSISLLKVRFTQIL